MIRLSLLKKKRKGFFKPSCEERYPIILESMRKKIMRELNEGVKE